MEVPDCGSRFRSTVRHKAQHRKERGLRVLCPFWLVLAPLSVQCGDNFQDFVWKPNLYSVRGLCPRFVGTAGQTGNRRSASGPYHFHHRGAVEMGARREESQAVCVEAVLTVPEL